MINFCKSVFRHFLPQFCVLCNKSIYQYKYPLCLDCQKSIQKIVEPVCKKCGRPLISEQALCTECRTTSYEFDCCSAVYQYRTPIHNVIVSYKGNGVKQLAHFFAEILYNQLQIKNWYGLPIVPVPPRKGKIKTWGWDQVARIAELLKKYYKIPIYAVLERGETSCEQKKLNKQDRKLIIKGQFSIKKHSKYIPESIVLLDDITTTCATLNECAGVLKTHGCKKIYALVIAID